MRKSPGELGFSFASVLLGLLAAGAAAGLVALLVTPGLLDGLRALPQNPWWRRYRDPGSDAMAPALWRVGAAAAAALVSLVAVFRLRTRYNREPSPVLPFVMVFFFASGLECLRAGTALLFAMDGPVAVSVLLTRAIYGGRFAGMLGLLFASLYCMDLTYRKFFLLAGVVVLVASAMAAYIPVDRTVFLAQLTWKLGDEQSVWFVTLAIEALTILTATAAALTRRGRRLVLLAVAIAVLVGSKELLSFALQPVPLAAGIAAQAAGAILCTRAFA